MREPFARSAIWRVWFDEDRMTRRTNLQLLWKIGTVRWTDIMVCFRAHEIDRDETDWLYLKIREYVDTMTGRPPADLPEPDAYWAYRTYRNEICPDCKEIRKVGEICSILGGSVHFEPRKEHAGAADVPEVREGKWRA